MPDEIVPFAARPPDLADLQNLGKVLAESGLFNDTRGAAQVVVKILAGRELGIPPIASMTGIHVIQNKATLSAGLMASCVRRSGRYDFRVLRIDDQACEIEFLRDGQAIGTSTFTMADAKRAGLDAGPNWRKYPRNMLFARAISNGARWYCPDLFAGSPVYTPDELGVEVDGETGEVLADDRIVTGPRLSPDQLARLQELIESTSTDVNQLQSHYGVPSLLDLSTEQHAGAVRILEDRLTRQSRSSTASIAAAEIQPEVTTEE